MLIHRRRHNLTLAKVALVAVAATIVLLPKLSPGSPSQLPTTDVALMETD